MIFTLLQIHGHAGMLQQYQAPPNLKLDDGHAKVEKSDKDEKDDKDQTDDKEEPSPSNANFMPGFYGIFYFGSRKVLKKFLKETFSVQCESKYVSKETSI